MLQQYLQLRKTKQGKSRTALLKMSKPKNTYMN